ncbi:spore germination protein [Paenibacillus sp. 481]|uniref:spore germination protein n=1 Tax=Paenibacillus sp. 481 TaxID=2835869 RepID=UPI001E3B0F09|nr:spore germination protein [Paenibacillus sp. 481]UHA73700.1 spore germination protein [Paenibacillus sp. 481]
MPEQPDDNDTPEHTQLSVHVADNKKMLAHLFRNNANFVVRELGVKQGEAASCVAYLNTLIDEKYVNEQLLHLTELTADDSHMSDSDRKSAVLSFLSAMGSVERLSTPHEMTAYLLEAGFICCIEGELEAFGVQIPGYKTRSIEESKIEPVVRGPREAFTEQIQTNLSMVYRRLKSVDLHAVKYKIGSNSKTEVQALYLQHLVNREVLTELERRMKLVKLDALIESAQLEEVIQDHVYSPFPQIALSERPDRIVAALNEGRIVLLVDGTPSALIVPSVFTDFLQASEDYYERYIFANLTRALRLIALVISLLGPSLYIALTTFHQEMLPTPLLLTFTAAKAGVPFPTFIEALIMEIAFELLREAGVRLPRTVGQTISIVGALIIGEAAVQSGIVSRPMVIVVATTGIASFAIPAFNAAIAFRILRFPFMFVSASLGVFGVALCALFLLLHLSSLRSFGIPFLSPIAPVRWKSWLNDIFVFPYPLRKSKHIPSPFSDIHTEETVHFQKEEESS